MTDERNVNVNIENEEELSEEQLTEQRRIRREKLRKLQEMGRNPFLIETWNVETYSKEVKENFEAWEGKRVSMAGRMMANRHMGKVSFVDVLDKEGKIQAYVSEDGIGAEEYEIFLTYDIGDIIGFEGEIFKTKRGEISVRVERLVLLSKSLQVLPNKWHGLKDIDQRYRQRYVDLIINSEVREMFYKRAAIISN